MAGSIIAAGSVLAVLTADRAEGFSSPNSPPKGRRSTAESQQDKAHSYAPPWLAITVLGASGFAALVHEIAWTRILSLVLGPTTYAFAATLAAVIAGVAIGSGVGSWLVTRRGVESSRHAGFHAVAGGGDRQLDLRRSGIANPDDGRKARRRLHRLRSAAAARSVVHDSADSSDLRLSRRGVSVCAGACRRSHCIRPLADLVLSTRSTRLAR